jgi:UTP--glucose-1-phosphate uridylyltransferase
MRKKIKKVVFPVGGLGTRFLPATKSMPKEMLPVYNKPLIQYAFEEARNAGIEQFIFITGRNKNIIANHFDHAYELQQVLNDKAKHQELEHAMGWLPEAGNIAFIRQQKPAGLGHAVYCAKNFIGNEPFAVILADELLNNYQDGFLKEMILAYEEINADINMVGVCAIEKELSENYGIIAGDTKSKIIKVTDMQEKPKAEDAPSNLAIVGRYILQPEIFAYLAEENIGAGGEIQLTDAMRNLLVKQDFWAKKFTGKRYDCGNPLGLLAANLAYGYEQNKFEVKEILTEYNE